MSASRGHDWRAPPTTCSVRNGRSRSSRPRTSTGDRGHDRARARGGSIERWAAPAGRGGEPGLAVAAAISGGRADCGLGVQAAARAFGLDFVPIAWEPYDLVLDRATLEQDLLAPLWRLLESDDFRAAVEELGGYDAAEMGKHIR